MKIEIFQQQMTLPTLRLEQKLWQAGYQAVVGLDEVGRGSWAGPVVAAAVIFPAKFKLCGELKQLRDSKQLSAEKRKKLAKLIKKVAQTHSTCQIGVSTINRVGIKRAAEYAMRKAIRLLKIPPDYHLIDAFYLKYICKHDQTGIIKGDAKIASIAAASILAKVYRDRLMVKLHREYPNYGFHRHKGYGTRLHQERIKKFGLCPLHRSVFVRKFIQKLNSPSL